MPEKTSVNYNWTRDDEELDTAWSAMLDAKEFLKKDYPSQEIRDLIDKLDCLLDNGIVWVEDTGGDLMAAIIDETPGLLLTLVNVMEGLVNSVSEFEPLAEGNKSWPLRLADRLAVGHGRQVLENMLCAMVTTMEELEEPQRFALLESIQANRAEICGCQDAMEIQRENEAAELQIVCPGCGTSRLVKSFQVSGFSQPQERTDSSTTGSGTDS